jgi:hypothetical protein
LIGLAGAGIAASATFFLMACAALFCSRRFITYRINWFDVGKATVACVVMGVVLYWTPTRSLASIAAAVLLGAGVYFAVLLILRTFSKAELAKMSQLFLPFRNIGTLFGR